VGDSPGSGHQITKTRIEALRLSEEMVARPSVQAVI